ncbi:CCA tRNA nucleotidyltransferase [Candidatus Woesearchaeota archaeon CG_4_10_14_0_2_um_filter_33_13]|nr:MAG: CCA tRNA nucleotidyltransferase [Candidatus Woesearchaeota archaeon CG_4_10_14_0_2_um_filter_33_13]
MKEVLAKITPNREERARFKQTTEEFLELLNFNLKGAQAILGGSGAKDTWLSGNFDVDIFVQFDFLKFSTSSDNLAELLQTSLKKAFPKIKLNRLHGSRDYFQLLYKDMNFEVVPILKINKAEEALNITDISPLHAIWVNKNTKTLKDQVRLAKQFCKANGLYGAESHICGFSGYVLEILTAYYGSFANLLQKSLKWKNPEVIDPEKYYTNKTMVMFHLNKSKLQSPLIIIDPVDKNRNTAAALSLEKFQLMQKKAKEYLKSPSAKFFVREEINLEQLKKEKGHLVYLQITPLEGKRDVVGVKLLKAFEFLKKELELFTILKAEWRWDKQAIFYFLLKDQKLDDYQIRRGPPLTLKEYVKDFKKKNKNTFEKDGQLFAKVKTEFPQLEDFVNDLLSKKYFKEKVLTTNLTRN